MRGAVVVLCLAAIVCAGCGGAGDGQGRNADGDGDGDRGAQRDPFDVSMVPSDASWYVAARLDEASINRGTDVASRTALWGVLEPRIPARSDIGGLVASQLGVPTSGNARRRVTWVGDSITVAETTRGGPIVWIDIARSEAAAAQTWVDDVQRADGDVSAAVIDGSVVMGSTDMLKDAKQAAGSTAATHPEEWAALADDRARRGALVAGVLSNDDAFVGGVSSRGLWFSGARIGSPGCGSTRPTDRFAELAKVPADAIVARSRGAYDGGESIESGPMLLERELRRGVARARAYALVSRASATFESVIDQLVAAGTRGARSAGATIKDNRALAMEHPADQYAAWWLDVHGLTRLLAPRLIDGREGVVGAELLRNVDGLVAWTSPLDTDSDTCGVRLDAKLVIAE